MVYRKDTLLTYAQLLILSSNYTVWYTMAKTFRSEMMSYLYERADIYDLIESDSREQIIRKDWAAFLGDREIHSMLDVSIGTGTMTLPLQELGITIFGSDLSESMLSRCQIKAENKHIPIELKCCDFRDLSCWGDHQFDCVVSTGNSLAYVSNEEVLQTLEQMDGHVKSGGYLCFDSRNWEKIQREKQRFYVFNPFYKDNVRVNYLQVWDHHDDGTITFNLLYCFEENNRIFQKEIFEEHYFPFPKCIIEKKMYEMGYDNIELRPLPCMIEETNFAKIDWYRLIGRKSI